MKNNKRKESVLVFEQRLRMTWYLMISTHLTNEQLVEASGFTHPLVDLLRDCFNKTKEDHLKSLLRMTPTDLYSLMDSVVIPR